MTKPLTNQQIAAITLLIGDARPANEDLVLSVAESVRDRREHQHDPGAEDLYCGNLSGWAGDRSAFLLRRLVDAESEINRLRSEVIKHHFVITLQWSERKSLVRTNTWEGTYTMRVPGTTRHQAYTELQEAAREKFRVPKATSCVTVFFALEPMLLTESHRP